MATTEVTLTESNEVRIVQYVEQPIPERPGTTQRVQARAFTGRVTTHSIGTHSKGKNMVQVALSDGHVSETFHIPSKQFLVVGLGGLNEGPAS